MTSILTDWGKRCIEKLTKGVIAEARFVFCLSCIANEFDEERARLKPERETLRDRVKVAKRRNKDIPRNVVSWEEEVDKLIQEDTKEKQTCFFGFCPDCIWRYKRGKKLANDTMEVKRLMEKVKEFVNVELPRPPPGVERNSLQDYISLKSRESKYKDLLDALKDDNNYITGLQGMGGTGKTTLAKKVGTELKDTGQFTYAIVTTVSSTPDVKKIQDDIAGPLGLELKDINESDRQGKLWGRLTEGEKILLILDDVWDEDPLDFDAIGIPTRGNHKGCRVLVTTRSKQLSNNMNFDKSIELELLSDEDVWTMFKRYANISESSSKDVKKKGREIAKECKKLPVVIAVIASSLRGHHDRMEKWDATLTSLKKPVTLDGVEADLVGVFNRLKVSYDNMNDEKAKGLFRLCSVFPEDEEISVEVLTRLCIGAGLFGEDYESYNDARNQVVIAKNKLLDYCLLLEDKENFVKMHDLIRDLAQWIARKEIRRVNWTNKNQRSLIEKETNIKCLLFEGSFKDLFFCKFDGSKLETLIAREDIDEDCNMDSDEDCNVDRDEDCNVERDEDCNMDSDEDCNVDRDEDCNVERDEDCNMDSDEDCNVDSDEDCNVEIPNSFIENIVKLRVLHLTCYGNRSLSLTNSFQSLKNIRAMMVQKVDLDYFKKKKVDLGDISVLGNLQSLEALELVKCKIHELPIEIEKLENLKLLRLESCEIGKGNPFEVFKKCTSLEELYFIDSFNGSCQEITLPAKLRRYHIGKWYWAEGKEKFFSQSKCVVYVWCWAKWNFTKGTLRYFMQTAEAILLNGINSGWKNLMPDMVPIENGMNDLVELHLSIDSELQCLIDTKHIDCQVPIVVFSKLVVLKLSNMERLEELCNGSISLDCLNNLQEVSIGHCNHLQSLFKCSLNLCNLKKLIIWSCSTLISVFALTSSQSLLQLETLEIDFCEQLENIFTYDGDNDNSKSFYSMFPNLKILWIERCPQLEFMHLCHSAGDLLSLESIRIEDCGKLKQLSKHPWDDTIEKKVNGDKNSSCNSIMFPNLKEVRVIKCPQLEFVLPLQPVQDLLLLETIIINSCDKLEYIFGQHQDVQLPSLKELKLLDLPNFIDIFRESNHSMPSSIKRSSNSISKTETQSEPIKSNVFSWSNICCHRYKLKGPTISVGTIKERDQCLLRLSHIMCNIEVISLRNLSKIKSVCDELKHIIVDNGGSSGSDNTVFPKLNWLKVENCRKLEYIFGNVEHFVTSERLKVDNSNEVSEREMNLGLQIIELYTLPMLTCLFKGLKKSFSLKNLTKMKIKGCEKLEFVFSTSIIMRLPQLLHIKIEECNELKHLIEDDLENRKTVCFPKLKSVVVVKCNRLKDVFPIYICKELPELEALMIKEADKLEEIFVCEEGDQKVNVPNLKFVVFVNLPSLCQTQGIHFQAVPCHSVQHCKNFSLTSAPREHIINYIDYFYYHPEQEIYSEIYFIIGQSQEETRDRETCNENPSSKTTEDIAAGIEASRHMLPSSQELVNQQHSLGEIDTTSKPSHGNDNLEDSTSEKPVVEPLSTISGTENEPPIQVIDHKQKGIMISVEKGTALTNTKTTSEDQSTQEGCTSGTKNDQDIQLDSHETAQTNNDQESKGCDNGNENPSVETTKDFDVGSKVQAASSGHEITSSQLQGSTSDKTAAETKNEPTAHLVSPKLKGIKNNAEKGSTSTNAKTITSSTQLELADGDGKIAMTTSFSNDEVSWNDDTFKKVSSNIKESKPSPSTTSPIDTEIKVQATLGQELILSQELMDEESMDEQCMMNPQDSEGEIDTTIKPSQGDKVVGDGKICIPSFSTVNTKPTPTKHINKLIEEDPHLAFEKLLTGQVSISSIRILLHELKSLMDSSSDLGNLISNQESKSKLISLFNQLKHHQGLLPSHMQEFIEKVQTLNDYIIKYATFQQVLKKHNQLLDSKTDLVNKLWSAYSTQTRIDHEISTANARIDELSLQTDEHRKELEDIKNQIEALKSVVNRCNDQKNKLKAECTEWAQQSDELISAFASSEVDVREAERARNLATEAFANLKSSFPAF